MKLYALITAILFLTMLFVPLFSLLGDGAEKTMSYAQVSSTEATEPSHTEKESEASEQSEKSDKVRVLRTSSGKVESVVTKDYLVGCVASEMLPTYHKEALKAQAVVSYTYVLYLLSQPYSDEADITDNSAVHQAYRNKKELKEKWGDRYEECISLVEEAVDEVEGEYLTYDGIIIKPAYHAMSSGRTNSALDVWGKDIPYLQSVTSDGDKLSPKLVSTYDFTLEEMKEKLSACSGESFDEVQIGESETNGGGYVKKLVISGVSFTGEKLRTAFSLRSGAFTLEKHGENYRFTCTGYGHGVGMSQNGAEYMAKNGFTYDEILRHYYQGTEIKS